MSDADNIPHYADTGHLRGDARVDTHYIAKTGWLTKRTPIELKFDKDTAVAGELVTLVTKLPKDAVLVYGNNPTEHRSFVMTGESIMVRLVGKYVGVAHCIRVSEEQLRKDMMQKAMEDFFRQTPQGQAILNATSVSDLRKI